MNCFVCREKQKKQRKQIRSFVFLENLWLENFVFEINWPLVENLQIVDISHLQCNLPTSSCQRSLWTTLSFLYIHIQVLGYTYELRHWQLKCSYFWNFMLPKVSTFHFSIWQAYSYYTREFLWKSFWLKCEIQHYYTSKYWIFDKVSTHK